MLSARGEKIAAREILTVASLLLLGVVLKACGGMGRLPFWWIAAGLYLARWVCWAIVRGDECTFRQSGAFLAFAGGIALVAGFVLCVADLVASRHWPEAGAGASLVMPLVGAVVGALLMRWSLKLLRADAGATEPD